MEQSLTPVAEAHSDIRVRTARLCRRLRRAAVGAVVLYLAIGFTQDIDPGDPVPWVVAGAIIAALLIVNALSRRWDRTRGHGDDRQRLEVAADALIAFGIFFMLTAVVAYQPYPLVVLLLAVEAALRLRAFEAMIVAWTATGIVLLFRVLAQAGVLEGHDDATLVDAIPMTVITLLMAWVVSATVTRLHVEHARAYASADQAARATALAEERADQLNQRNAELREARDQFERFSTKVAHDLRSPLATIVMMTKMMARPDTDEVVRAELSGRILPSAQRAVDLVDRLHADARSALHEVRVAPVDVGALLAQVTADLDVGMHGDQLSVTVEGVLPVVHGDEVLLRQVLTNLLSNARVHARVDGGRVHVRVTGGIRGDQAWLNLHDDGDGVPEEIRASIFDTGRSGHTSLGLGLGLSTCRDVVERHGGHIVLDQSDVGASFTLTLPVRELAAAGESNDPPRVAAPA